MSLVFPAVLYYKPAIGETVLCVATFQATVGDFDFSMEHEYLGSRLADALEEHPQSWLVSAVASLFWRVEGNYPEAVECLRHSVHFAPAQAKDVGLLGLANLLHNARLDH